MKFRFHISKFIFVISGIIGMSQNGYSSNFPEIIYKAMDDADSELVSLESLIKSSNPSSMSNDEERGVFAFSKGLMLLDTDPKAAAEAFESAKKLIPEKAPFYALISIYHGQATLSPKNARAVLSNLKTISKRASNTQYWRPEQFNLMLEILMVLKSDSLLAKTWSEMESRVRPAQRSDDMARKVAHYIDSRRIRSRSELIPVVESLAASYPHSETARWAFQKLQSLTCDRQHPYVFSLPLISRLAGNTNLDEGLKLYLIELIKGPVRTMAGQIKTFDPSERLDYLVQVRFWNEARHMAEDQLESLKGTESSDGKIRLAKVLNSLGQIQIKQGDYEAAAKTWSFYLAKFAGQVDWRPATENLADSLSRLKQNAVAAKMYETLAQSPSADPILKWHHFWNTYLSGNLKEALALLDRPGYVPQRDRGIEGGLDYWRAKILEKTGQEAEAEALYLKILNNNGDNFYSLMVQARKPKLIDRTKVANSSISTVSFDEMSESNGFLPANEIPVTELQKPVLAESEVRTVLALKKWGQSQVARRVFRLIPTINNKNGQGTWVESFRMALDLRDFSYGLKAPTMADSPLRSIPNSAVHLEEHMTKYSADWKLLYPYAIVIW